MQTSCHEGKEENQRRFQMELEFVQCLANPQYLQFLAQQRIFKDPAFINYLSYLTYWQQPKYAKYIVYIVFNQISLLFAAFGLFTAREFQGCLTVCRDGGFYSSETVQALGVV